MQQLIGPLEKCLLLDPFLKKVIQFDLLVKTHVVEHSQIAMRSLLIKKMEMSGHHFVRSLAMKTNSSLSIHSLANTRPWDLNMVTVLSAQKH